MGYQALLFCPDEKLARVVTQVFTELDFQVEAVNEPFAAVKKLMAQRYDAVVVDCENEQNATLLFKSARNSSSNQSSLALALVEGQAGVAKAYRIGANLVLTKPINVEQAKGTLRVARGLLRKNADAAMPAMGSATRPATTPATPATASKPVAVSPSAPSKPQSAMAEPVMKPGNIESPAFESALPAMAASADNHEIQAAAPMPWSKIPIDAEPAIQFQDHSAAPEPAASPAATSPAVTAKKPFSPASISQGAAAAPAPAKEAPATSDKSHAESDLFEAPAAPAPTASATHARSSETVPAPTFAAFGGGQESEESGGNKKMLAIAAVVVIAAGLGYVGWTKFGKSSAVSTQPAVSAPLAVQTPAPVTPPPSAPANTLSEAAKPSPSAAPVSSAPQPAKPPATVNNAPAKIAIATEPAVAKPEPAPIHVRTQTTASRPKAATEEAAPQVPNPLSLGAASDKSLSGLVASTPVNIPRQAPGTLKISQGVSQGLLINRVQPKYPPNALAMRIQGAVQIDATISKEGKISNLKPTSGDPVLARAAMEAVRQWRYKPYFLDGQPVDIQTQITVNFKLPN